MIFIFTDGGARGNPGPGAIGVVFKDNSHKTIFEFGSYLGTCTNNEAEYQAILTGLKYALDKNFLEVECYLDSELVVKQLNGGYKVKNDRLLSLHKKVKEVVENFDKVKFSHIPREKNREADALVNKVLDSVLNNVEK